MSQAHADCPHCRQDGSEAKHIALKEVRIALAGNPNCGKTTLFNQLTGSNQHVGNFPGVTVDKKEGVIRGHNTCEHRHGPRSWGHPKTPAPAVYVWPPSAVTRMANEMTVSRKSTLVTGKCNALMK